MSTHRKRMSVEEWVTSALAETPEGKSCTAITLLHMKGLGGQSEEVKSRPISGPQNPADLAEFFMARASGYSQDLPGLQDFKLLAFYGTNTPGDTFLFTMSDGKQVARTEAMNAHHEPTPTGTLQQTMKHLENMTSLCLQSITQTQTMMNGILGMWAKEREDIRRTEIETIGIVRHATLSMLKERQDTRIMEIQAAQEMQTRKLVADAVPHLINRWTGREVFSEVANKAKMFDELALSTTPQDLEMLVQIGRISREKALVLSAQFAAVVEEKRREMEALQKVPAEDETAMAAAHEGLNGKVTPS